MFILGLCARRIENTLITFQNKNLWTTTAKIARPTQRQNYCNCFFSYEANKTEWSVVARKNKKNQIQHLQHHKKQTEITWNNYLQLLKNIQIANCFGFLHHFFFVEFLANFLLFYGVLPKLLWIVTVCQFFWLLFFGPYPNEQSHPKNSVMNLSKNESLFFGAPIVNFLDLRSLFPGFPIVFLWYSYRYNLTYNIF